MNSCRDAVLDGYVLRATCKDNGGVWRPTWIDTRQCAQGQQLEVDDGLFVCVTPPPPRMQPMKDMLPQGSWIDACRSGAVKNWQMRAECYAGNGQWYVTDLDLSRCKRNDVSADDGRLRCR